MSNIVSTQKHRIEWIDLAKGFSIILVVYGHCGLASVPFIGDWFAAFRMPFFFFVSGLLFNPAKFSKTSSFIIKKWPTLLRPFILFSVIVFACFYFIDEKQFHDRLRNFYLLGWGGYALWFIPVLFLTQLIFLFVCKATDSERNRLFLILVLAITGFITYKIDVPNYWNINFTLTAVLFFRLGSIMCTNFNTFINSKPIYELGIFLTILIIVLISYLYNNPKPEFFINHLGGGIITHISAISGTLMLCTIAVLLSRIKSLYLLPIKSMFKYMGRNSYVVLAFHQIILIALGSFVLNISGSVERIIMWFILVILIEAITRYSPWILGRKKTQRTSINKKSLRSLSAYLSLNRFTNSSK